MISILQVLEQGGLEYDGVWITDIYYDETGRHEVDPREYYNINFKLD